MGLWKLKFPIDEDDFQWFGTYMYYLCLDTTYGYLQGSEMGIVHRLFSVARASLLQHCSCLDSREPRIREVVPRCPSWPALEGWAVQFLACGSRVAPESDEMFFQAGEGADYFSRIVGCLQAAITESNQGRPLDMSPEGESPWELNTEYALWERTVDLTEVCALISWINGLSGNYLFLQPTNLLDSTTHVAESFSLSSSMGLCPHRVWCLATNAPGHALNLLPLIPSVASPLPSWRQDHPSCTPSHCTFSNLDFSSVKQLHVCDSPHLCTKNPTLFPQSALLAAVAAGTASSTYVPTAWSLSGLTIAPPGAPFLAISHVWSDGTGIGTWTRGIVNPCVWSLFVELAHQLNCTGIWWDAVCLPTHDPAARIAAINVMHENYTNATVTLIHDRFLSTAPYTSAASAAFALIASSWFTRGWTSLELRCSRNVKVLYSDARGQHPLIKDLDSELLTQPYQIAPAHHMFASTVVRNLRGEIKALNGLLESLGPRYTSKPWDIPVIAGLLCGVPNPADMAEEETYRELLRRVGNVFHENLMHSMQTMQEGGWSWCARQLLKMPVGRERGRFRLTLQEGGELIGFWLWSCMRAFSSRIRGVVEGASEEVVSALEEALADPDRHLLLTKSTYARRGVVVKVRVDEEKEELKVQWVAGVELVVAEGMATKTAGARFVIGSVEGLPELTTMGLRACQAARKFPGKPAVPKYIYCCQGDHSQIGPAP